MDRFKFRAWDKEYNCYDTDLFMNLDGALWDRSNLTHNTPNTEIEPAKPYTIEQCTGKKIANNLIFEGDIGRHWNSFYQRFDYFVMKWLDNGPNALFAWVQTKAPTLTYKPLHKFTLSERCIREGACEMMEPCGNIHDNPELLA